MWGYPPTPQGTLTPFIPLSLRAFKGEGEGKTEGCTCAKAQVHPSSLVLGGRGMDSRPRRIFDRLSGAGMIRLGRTGSPGGIL